MTGKKEVRPWDLFNKNFERALPEIAKKRLSICKQCPEYIKLTHQCKKCGCIMNAKVKLIDATCPLNKWGHPDIPIDREITEEEIKRISN